MISNYFFPREYFKQYLQITNISIIVLKSLGLQQANLGLKNKTTKAQIKYVPSLSFPLSLFRPPCPSSHTCYHVVVHHEDFISAKLMPVLCT